MKLSRSSVLFALVTLLAVACGGGGEPAPAPSAGAPAAAAAPAAAGPAGSIGGVVTYANGDPDAPIQMNADPQCLAMHPTPVESETVVTDGGGHLANVFVYVKQGARAGGAAPGAHVLDQRGCQYHPHVSGMMVNQKLVIRNSDATLHNVHALPKTNEEFNQGQPFQGMELERSFDRPEVMIAFKCDVHPWMRSYMGVLDHPYFAVSGADGSFSIANLPAGTYTLEAWHETLGAQMQEVTVAAGQTAQVSFDFKPTA